VPERDEDQQSAELGQAVADGRLLAFQLSDLAEAELARERAGAVTGAFQLPLELRLAAFQPDVLERELVEIENVVRSDHEQ